MIRNTKELMEEIRKRIAEKYGESDTDYFINYELRWLGGHRVQVTAWQEDWDATFNRIEFSTTMTKNAMRENEDELLYQTCNSEEGARLVQYLYCAKTS